MKFRVCNFTTSNVIGKNTSKTVENALSSSDRVSVQRAWRFTLCEIEYDDLFIYLAGHSRKATMIIE